MSDEVHERLSIEELAALVCSTLERHEVRVVLSGGSVVSIYSDDAYQSYDLAFIQPGLARRVDAAMNELGFSKGGRHWSHPRSRFLVEFPPGPVQVGDALVTEFAERSTRLGVLRLLAPTAPRERLDGEVVTLALQDVRAPVGRHVSDGESDLPQGYAQPHEIPARDGAGGKHADRCVVREPTA